ncbi:hypothetical protein J7J47_16440 [Halomonas sp. ISL-60]|uniref:hypothetical protein n=1 Tax=Halomonas sp. ISL-56 TaxID=2819149 RepID=UPI001BEB7615|nr:hypothetical protein [Halomonas sp. ISL-56]MBT2773812.1 hypothetical protein [Halomonas sp. ISL-60]MBT2800004.1 hypothetical protein [Halomonas sp. ISL-56]
MRCTEPAVYLRERSRDHSVFHRCSVLSGSHLSEALGIGNDPHECLQAATGALSEAKGRPSGRNTSKAESCIIKPNQGVTAQDEQALPLNRGAFLIQTTGDLWKTNF